MTKKIFMQASRQSSWMKECHSKQLIFAVGGTFQFFKRENKEIIAAVDTHTPDISPNSTKRLVNLSPSVPGPSSPTPRCSALSPLFPLKLWSSAVLTLRVPGVGVCRQTSLFASLLANNRNKLGLAGSLKLSFAPDFVLPAQHVGPSRPRLKGHHMLERIYTCPFHSHLSLSLTPEDLFTHDLVTGAAHYLRGR